MGLSEDLVNALQKTSAILHIDASDHDQMKFVIDDVESM